MQVKKQSTQLRQSGAAVKDAEQTAETAQQQYKEHLQQLQSQLEQAQGTARDTVSSPDTAGAESALHAELQSLRSQLAEAQQEVTSLQQQQAHGGSSASVLPNSNPSTPSKTGAASSPAHDSAAPESVAQDSSIASAEKEVAKDKDAQLQVVPECMSVRVSAHLHTTSTSASCCTANC